MADAEAMDVDVPQTVKADGPSDKKKGKEKGSKRFEIKKWNAVAMWSWAICTDTCAICRNNLYEPSIEYQANPTGERPGEVCSHGSGRTPYVSALYRQQSYHQIFWFKCSACIAFTGHMTCVSCRNDTLQLWLKRLLHPAQVTRTTLASALPGACAVTSFTWTAFSGGSRPAAPAHCATRSGSLQRWALLQRGIKVVACSLRIYAVLHRQHSCCPSCGQLRNAESQPAAASPFLSVYVM